MRYLSLFSGIEAASVAWEPLGWECVAVAEVDAFASAVLAHRYPSVPNLGDVTKIDAADLAALGRIDLVVFGSPCQDLSVAGKREGLAGERSRLFHTAVDIVRWAREYCGCRWALWENVCGAFSSNKGRDFAAVVGELAGVDVPVPPKGWGTEGAAVGSEGMVEWAVLDAQWFGVAQRRRRVFALADFGDWASRPPVLLEPQSLRGDSPPRREPGQGASADVAPGAGAGCEPYTLAIRGREGGATLEARQDGVSNAILTPTGGRSGVGVGAVAHNLQVRRLTPTEAERLMGFPDGWTAIPYRGKPAADGPRYKSLGNSMAIPVVSWIGRQIEIAESGLT